MAVDMRNTSESPLLGVFDRSDKLRGIRARGNDVMCMGMFTQGNQSTNSRIISRFKSSRPTLNMLRIFGDSYANDQGATLPAKGWTALLFARFSSLFKNGKGVVSVPANTMGKYIVNVTSGDYYSNISKDDVFVGFTGFNDVRTYDLTSEAALTTNKLAAASMLAWLATPTSNRVPVRDPANRAAGNPLITFTGTWNHTRGGGQESVGSLNATAEHTPAYEWDTMYIHAKGATGSTGCVRVDIDGTAWATFYTTTAYAQAVNGWEPMLFTVKVPRGTHTAKVTVVTDTLMVTDFNFFDSEVVDGPLVIVGEYPNLSDTAWAIGSTVGTANNVKANDPANVAAASAGGATWKPQSSYGGGGRRRHLDALRQVVQMLQSDGLNIIMVPVGEQMDPTKHINAADVHMSDQGHQVAASAFSGELGKLY